MCFQSVVPVNGHASVQPTLAQVVEDSELLSSETLRTWWEWEPHMGDILATPTCIIEWSHIPPAASVKFRKEVSLGHCLARRSWKEMRRVSGEIARLEMSVHGGSRPPPWLKPIQTGIQNMIAWEPDSTDAVQISSALSFPTTRLTAWLQMKTLRPKGWHSNLAA